MSAANDKVAVQATAIAKAIEQKWFQRKLNHEEWLGLVAIIKEELRK
jgi:hypothetical protein